MKNDVFTEAFFDNMTSISPFLNVEAMLQGEAAEGLVSYLKGLQLEPAVNTPLVDTQPELRYGGNQGYCIHYQNGEMVHFFASEALLTINSKNYYVVDKDGKLVPEFGETIWKFFHPEA